MADFPDHPASYRDPSGFLFYRDGELLRQVNHSYADNYQLLMRSGLYDSLVNRNKLIPHREVSNIHLPADENRYLILRPDPVAPVTYPAEWSFSQLRDAALLTLSLLRESVEKGMILKDATPYNILFYRGGPVWIDTLSFERYDGKQPWIAYRQFCEQYLFPLYIEHFLGGGLLRLFNAFPQGIPASLTARMLPFRARLRLGVWLNVYLQHTVSSNVGGHEPRKFSKKMLLNLADHLEQSVARLSPPGNKTSWSEYYRQSPADLSYRKEKEAALLDMLEGIPVGAATDFGANEGYFSLLLSRKGFKVTAVDADYQSIEQLYREMRAQKINNLLPLVADLSAPTPPSGFMNGERPGLTDRIAAPLAVALALTHHLFITHYLNWRKQAEFFASVSERLLVEFVPPRDEKIALLLRGRILPEAYQQDNFEAQYRELFRIVRKTFLPDSGRTIYLMEKR